MKETIKKIISEQSEKLPVLSFYWESEGDFDEHHPGRNIPNLFVISSSHNTSFYLVRTFYKPISTSLDLTMYDSE
jgi:hypothetical protein